MRPNPNSKICFEVASDVLYYNGRFYYRGDLISSAELGDIAFRLEAIGLIRQVAQSRYAA